MCQHSDTQSRNVRRFFPKVIETCSRRVEGTYARPDTADTRKLKEQASPGSDTENKSSMYLDPVSENVPEDVGPESRRLKEIESQESIGRQQLGRPLPEPAESARFKKQRVGSQLGTSCRVQTPLLPDKPIHDRPRRFAPEVIETGKRSFRRGGVEQVPPSQCVSLKNQPKYSNKITSSANKPLAVGSESVPESRFSYSSLLQRQQTRRHSFRVPDLPTISSNLNEENEGSEGELPVLTSSSDSPDESLKLSHGNSHHQESCDESHSGHLLSLASHSAEKQLKEQALAAFPNEQVYQSVDHFAIDKEEGESSGHEEFIISSENIGHTRYRRASSADLSWALENMRLHKEEAEMRNRAMIGTNRLQSHSAFSTLHRDFHNDENLQNTGLVGEVKRSTSPPMLGDDLIFPQSVSPQSTLCADDHLISHQAKQDESCGDCGALWLTGLQASKSGGGGGLWMGTCQNANENAPRTQQGLLPGIPITNIVPCGIHTPDRFGTYTNTTNGFTNRRRELEGMDRKSGQEDNTSEFHDGFVTQIYNYLSLGYPCVARYYDYELSEISGIPVEELRQDDLHTDAKGYAGVTRGNPCGGDSGKKCTRWVALRLYIDEFAKHQSQMDKNVPTVEAWGVRERKGSWAL
ncbi:hypothetical protein PHISCL_01138 [Aspergillus sclerotialis]|uniref:Uncharacterized protein n=1 Tax=Aspergillus sclerotialis TaxID=2070753 RepID=A0A3A3A961_9EURO|nr:hypothetical protein PHISCL_01138 [Aspergillus sclerotialis]